MSTSSTSRRKKTSEVMLGFAEVVETRIGRFSYFKNDAYTGECTFDEDQEGYSAIGLMQNELRPGSIVFDIGAHVGFHSQAFAEAVGKNGQVWAFEADANFMCLARLNCVANGTEATVRLFQVVASNELAVRQFRTFDFRADDSEQVVGVDDLSGTDRCITAPIDTLASGVQPDLVRLDARGLELLALKGMRQTLQKSRPRVFIQLKATTDFDEIAVFMSQCGYDIYSFNGSQKSDLDRPQNFYCVVPDRHIAPKRLKLFMSAIPIAAQTQFLNTLSENIEPTASSFLTLKSDVSLSHDLDHAYWAWQTVRSSLREFVSNFLQIGLGKLEPEFHAGLIRISLDFLAAETAAFEIDALRQLLFQSLKSLRLAIEQSKVSNEDRATLTKKLENQAAEIVLLSRTRSEALAKNDNLIDELSITVEHSKILETRLEVLEAQKSSLDETSAALQQQEALLRLEVSKAQIEKANEIAASVFKAERLEEVERKFEALRHENILLLQAEAKQNEQVQNLVEKLGKLEIELKRTSEKNLEIIQSEQSSQAMVQATQQLVSRVSQQLQAREKEVESLKSENDQILTELEATQAELKEASAGLAERELAVEALIEAKVAKEADFKELEAELALRSQASAEAASAQALELSQAHAAVSDHELTIEALLTAKTASQMELSGLKEQLDRLTQASADADSARALELSQAHAAVSEHELTIEALLTAKAASQIELSGLREQLDRMTQASAAADKARALELSQAHAVVSEHELTIEALLTAKAASQIELSGLREQLDRMTQASAAADKARALELSQAHAVVSEHERTIEALLTAKTASQIELSALKEQLERLTQASAESDHVRLLEVESLQSSLAERALEITELSSKKQTVEAELAALRIQLKELAASASETASTLSLELREFQGDIHEKQMEIEALNAKHSFLEREAFEDLELLKQRFFEYVPKAAHLEIISQVQVLQQETDELRQIIRSKEAGETDLRDLLHMQSEELSRLRR